MVKRGCGKMEEVFETETHCIGNYDVFPPPPGLYKECNDFCTPPDDSTGCNGNYI